MKIKCPNCGELINTQDGTGNFNEGYTCDSCDHVVYPREVNDDS